MTPMSAHRHWHCIKKLRSHLRRTQQPGMHDVDGFIWDCTLILPAAATVSHSQLTLIVPAGYSLSNMKQMRLNQRITNVSRVRLLCQRRNIWPAGAQYGRQQVGPLDRVCPTCMHPGNAARYHSFSACCSATTPLWRHPLDSLQSNVKRHILHLIDSLPYA